MPSDRLTHFVQENGRHTLCGRPVTSIILNERPPTCRVCSDEWAAKTGWDFPLPDVGEAG